MATVGVIHRSSMPCRRLVASHLHPRRAAVRRQRSLWTRSTAHASALPTSETVRFDGDGKVGDAYGISGLPTTFFIRTDGAIEGRYIGETNAGILGPHIGAIGA